MRPNRMQLIISGVLLTIALILTLVFSQKPGAPAPVAAKSSEPRSIHELVARPVDIKAALAEAPQAISAPCAELWTRIANSSLEQFLLFPESDKASMQSCSDAVPILAKHDAANLAKLRASCSSKDEPGSNAMASNCSLYFYFYKAALVAWLDQKKPLAQLSSAELALQFFHEYYSRPGDELNHLAQLIDELLIRHPSYSTRKAKASIQLFLLMQDQSHARATELQKLFNELEQEEAGDEQVYEMHFVLLSMLGDLKQMDQLTDNYVKANPSSALVYYLRSAYYWQTRDRAKTLETLKQAIALDPGNAHYEATRAQVEKSKPGSQGVYQANVTIDLLSD